MLFLKEVLACDSKTVTTVSSHAQTTEGIEPSLAWTSYPGTSTWCLPKAAIVWKTLEFQEDHGSTTTGQKRAIDLHSGRVSMPPAGSYSLVFTLVRHTGQCYNSHSTGEETESQ
jgi:hypothetical protein